jgi:hypothetical protein
VIVATTHRYTYVDYSQEIQSYMQVYIQVKDDFIKILDQLDHFGATQADLILERVMDTELEIQEREFHLDDFFKQLSSLAEWYTCYASSYNYLLLEIERRKKAQEKQEALKRDLLKKFEDAYHGKKKNNNQFRNSKDVC